MNIGSSYNLNPFLKSAAIFFLLSFSSFNKVS